MFPLHFYYEDVSRQDPLLKPNNNVMEVPGSSSIRVVPIEDGMFHVVNLAMEIPLEQKDRMHSFSGSTGSSQGQKVVSIHFKKEVKDGYVSNLARQSTLRGHGMYNFSVRISTVMSLLEDPEIREHSILFYWETEFVEFFPELEEHFEIFEQGLFNVTLFTSANTKDETLPPWSGFVQKEA